MASSDRTASILSFRFQALKSIPRRQGRPCEKGRCSGRTRPARSTPMRPRRRAARQDQARCGTVEAAGRKGLCQPSGDQDAETAFEQALSERTRVEFNRSLTRHHPADGVVLGAAEPKDREPRPATVSRGGGGHHAGGAGRPRGGTHPPRCKTGDAGRLSGGPGGPRAARRAQAHSRSRSD